MKAFRTKEQKEELLAQIKRHQELDAFIQGKWLRKEMGKIKENGFRGCFYGCTMQSENNSLKAFSEKYQIDLWYVYLTERIFEGLPKGEFKKFPYAAIEIIPVGFDFKDMKPRFFWLLLEDQKRFAGGDKEVLDVIRQCQKLFEVDFDKIDLNSARAARAARAAESATESAARAAESATESAARSAAEFVTWSAESATESAHYVFIRDFLFRLINDFK